MNAKFFLGAAALLLSGIAFGQCPLRFEGADQALIGVYIAPVGGGTPLVDYNSERMFTPASVMKSVTVGAAIGQRGGDFRWETKVCAVGKIGADGTLRGDIVVVGSGDPTLGSAQFSENRQGFVEAVKDAAALRGIRSVSGAVVNGSGVWPDLGPVPSWEIEDIPGVDGAGFYPLNYSDNIFLLSYPSMTSTPSVPGLKVEYLGGSGGLRFTRFPGSSEVRVYGHLPRKQTRATFKCSMPNPQAVVLAQLTRALSAGEKAVKAAGDTLVLLTYQSPALRDVARSLMVRSDNQMAEATLRLLAPRESRGKALATERTILSGAGANLKNARLADGSGLSRHNAISPRQLCSVLSAMAGNGDYVGSFARVGLDGTVRSFMKGMKGRDNFVLKSGSMTGVVCYVGYRLDPKTKAPTHVVAMMVNNAPNASAARAAMAKLLSATF